MPKQFTVTAKGEEITFESKFDTLDDAVEVVKKNHASNFARELVEKHEKYGLSDKQAAWIHKLANEEPRESRDPLALGLTGIAAMLKVKTGKGRPKLKVADGVVVTLNGERSKNPGHVTVTDGGPYGENRYYGRIDDDGTIYPGREFTDEVQQALVAFNNQHQKEADAIDDEDLPF